jgi:hypothetical protein
MNSSLIESGKVSAEEQKMGQMLVNKGLEWVLPPKAGGQAIAWSNEKDGILTVSNLSLPIEGSALTTLSATSIMASVALPAFTSVKARAQETKQLNDAKQIAVGLLAYSAEKNKFPATLEQLVEEHYLGDGLLINTNPDTGEVAEWLYTPGLSPTSDPASILLASPFVNSKGQRMVAHLDGSTELMPEEIYQEKIKVPAPVLKPKKRK